MFFKYLKSFSVTLLVLLILFGLAHLAQVKAQENPELTPEQRKQLEAQLQKIEQEIADQQKILDQKRQEGSSISRDISILNAQIKQAQLKIQAHTLAINRLGKDITVKVQIIDTLNTHISEEQESLSQIIRQTDQRDSFTLAEALLSNQDLSDFLLDLDAYASLNRSLKVKMDEIEAAKSQNEKEKENLNQKRNQEIDTRVNVQNEQDKIKKAETEKARLLSLNKQEQANYQGVIANKQAEAEIVLYRETYLLINQNQVEMEMTMKMETRH